MARSTPIVTSAPVRIGTSPALMNSVVLPYWMLNVLSTGDTIATLRNWAAAYAIPATIANCPIRLSHAVHQPQATPFMRLAQ